MQTTPARHDFRLGYRPSLDGIRGVSILCVLAVHSDLLPEGFGFYGVNTFFVLSGFLITGTLVLEWEKYGKIKLSSFYLRRALRLLPALLAMLLAVTIYALTTMSRKELHKTLHEVGWTLIYFMNWARIMYFDSSQFLTHTWSLSVEEQFYFCWPLLLLLMLKKTTRSSILNWIALGITLCIVLRMYFAKFSVFFEPDRLILGLDTRADSLLVGCFAAIAITADTFPGWKMDRRLMTLFSVLSGLGLIALCFGPYKDKVMACAGWLAGSIFAAVIIWHLVSSSQTYMHLILEIQPLVFVGRISYGIYVWHYPILMVAERYTTLPRSYLLMWILTFPVAIASYYLIELPFLRLKGRFKRAERPIQNVERAPADVPDAAAS